MLSDPSPVSFRRLTVTGIFLSLFTAGLAWLLLFPVQPTWYDDAYMFLRYANNMIHGQGITWNPGEPAVYGVGSLLYLIQIAGLVRLTGFSDGVFLASVSLANGVAALFILAAAIVQIVRSGWLRNACFIFGGVGVLLTFNFSFRDHLSTGMDTTLAMALGALLVLCFARLRQAPSASRAAILGIVSWLCFFCRIDMILYAVFFPVLGIWLLLEKEQKKMVLVWASVFGLLMVLDSLAKWKLFGGLFPLPLYTKQQGFYPNGYGALALSPVSFLVDYLGACLPFAFLAIFAFRRPGWRLWVVFFLPLLLTTAIFFGGVQIMGYRGRFYFPGLPFFVAGSFVLLDDFIQSRTVPVHRLLLRAVIAAGVLAVVSTGFVRLEAFYQARMRRAENEHYDVKLRNYLLQNSLKMWSWWDHIHAVDAILDGVPAGTRFAATENGYLAAMHPEMEIQDMTGLHDPEIARNGFSSKYILSKKPDLIWFPHIQHTDAVRLFWDENDFWTDYEYYPRSFGFGIALRRTGPHYAEVKKAVAAAWQKSYPGIDMSAERVSSKAEILAQLSSQTAPGKEPV